MLPNANILKKFNIFLQAGSQFGIIPKISFLGTLEVGENQCTILCFNILMLNAGFLVNIAFEGFRSDAR